MVIINEIKKILNNAISDGKFLMTCKIGMKETEPINAIFLYYTNDNTFTGETRAAYYSVGVQVAARHDSYDKARAVAILANKKLKSNPDATTGLYIVTVSPPEYKGVDALGGYIFGFDTRCKGGE